MDEIYSIGALIEHGDDTINIPVREVTARGIEDFRNEIREQAPVGSTVTFDPAIRVR